MSQYLIPLLLGVFVIFVATALLAYASTLKPADGSAQGASSAALVVPHVNTTKVARKPPSIDTRT